jgi:hypothetical protein
MSKKTRKLLEDIAHYMRGQARCVESDPDGTRQEYRELLEWAEQLEKLTKKKSSCSSGE